MITDAELLGLEVERLSALQAQRAAIVTKEEAKRDNGLAFYKPYISRDRIASPQDAFHRAGAFKHRLWEAGNRSGKSTGGVAEDCSWLLGERIFYPKTDPARRLGIPQHPVKGLVICADWDKVDELFTNTSGELHTRGKLWTMLPSGFVKKTRKNHTGAIDFIECVNGSTLRFDTVRSYIQNPQGSESSDIDFLHLDEPLPEEMHTAHARGLMDRDGKEWFCLTPLTEPWIHDRFFPDSHAHDLAFSYENYWAQRTSTYDNTTLTADAIDDFMKHLTEDERQCRELGIPLELSGLVYKQFSHDVHILRQVPHGWADYNNPPANYSIYYAIDPHPQTPHHVLFLAVSPNGHLFLFDELYIQCPIDQLSEMITERIHMNVRVGDRDERVMRNVYGSILDPLGFIQHPTMGEYRSMADDFYQCGLILAKAMKALSQGILTVQKALIARDYAGQPTLHVSPYLKETIYEFGHYIWDTGAKGDKSKNKPVDKRDHAMENLYRLLIEQPIWIDPTPAPLDMDELTITAQNLDDWS